MSLLCLLAGWWYGADVGRLGDPDYRVRAAADARLRSAGWLAYPAVLDGLASECPERAERCERIGEALVNRLPTVGTLADWAAVGVLGADADAIPDHTLYRLAGPLCGRLARSKACADRTNRTTPAGVSEWVERPPHLGDGTPAGDLRHLVETVRQARRDGR